MFNSCSKKDASLNGAAKAHADSLALIMGNWKFVQDSLNAYHNTFHDSLNTIGEESDTWNFKADSTLEINETNGLQTTVSREFTNDSKVNIPLSLNPLIVTIALCSSIISKVQTYTIGATGGIGESWILYYIDGEKNNAAWNVGLSFTYHNKSHIGFGADVLYSAEGATYNYSTEPSGSICLIR